MDGMRQSIQDLMRPQVRTFSDDEPSRARGLTGWPQASAASPGKPAVVASGALTSMESRAEPVPLCPACAAPLRVGVPSCAACGSSPTTADSPRAKRRTTLRSNEAADEGAVTRLEPALDPLIGQTVAGRFLIEALLGAGGVGKVYRARQLGLERLACVKLLRPGHAQDRSVVARFEREARAASRLTHENCVQVYDFGQHDGVLYLAMEYVDGRDLRTLLQQEHPLGVKRACLLTAQILAALSEAHAHGIVHRDLKPENVMVTTRRGAELVKVLDFGIARLLDADEPALTAVGRVCGTPLYMSPEQATGAAVDARSDLYAVGVLLYQLLTGVVPFASMNTMEVLTRHVTETPRSPMAMMPGLDLPPRLERLVLQALAKSAEDRPRSASVFRAELLAIAAMAVELPQVPISPALQLTPVSVSTVARHSPPKEAPTVLLGSAVPTDELDDELRALVRPRVSGLLILVAIALVAVAALALLWLAG